jgi:hypothetical protein
VKAVLFSNLVFWDAILLCMCVYIYIYIYIVETEGQHKQRQDHISVISLSTAKTCLEYNELHLFFRSKMLYTALIYLRMVCSRCSTCLSMSGHPHKTLRHYSLHTLF